MFLKFQQKVLKIGGIYIYIEDKNATKTTNLL